MTKKGKLPERRLIPGIQAIFYYHPFSTLTHNVSISLRFINPNDQYVHSRWRLTRVVLMGFNGGFGID